MFFKNFFSPINKLDIYKLAEIIEKRILLAFNLDYFKNLIHKAEMTDFFPIESSRYTGQEDARLLAWKSYSQWGELRYYPRPIFTDEDQDLNLDIDMHPSMMMSPIERYPMGASIDTCFFLLLFVSVHSDSLFNKGFLTIRFNTNSQSEAPEWKLNLSDNGKKKSSFLDFISFLIEKKFINHRGEGITRGIKNQAHFDLIRPSSKNKNIFFTDIKIFEKKTAKRFNSMPLNSIFPFVFDPWYEHLGGLIPYYQRRGKKDFEKYKDYGKFQIKMNESWSLVTMEKLARIIKIKC